jgi:hypothetical protein
MATSVITPAETYAMALLSAGGRREGLEIATAGPTNVWGMAPDDNVLDEDKYRHRAGDHLQQAEHGQVRGQQRRE